MAGNAATAEGNRAAIESALQAKPGAGYRDLQRSTGIPSGTLRHHLNVLGRRGRVWWITLGNRLLHFTGQRPTTQQDVLEAVTVTFDALDGRIYLLIRDAGGLCQKDILDAVPAPRSSVQMRLKRLVRYGVLLETPRGARSLWYTASPDLDARTHPLRGG